MYINMSGEIKVRVKGVDRALLELARTDDAHKRALKRGVREAAEMLMQAIKSKFGSYQATGGTGGGAWARLTFDTMKQKLRKYGFSGKPLVGTGKMRDSFYVKDGGEGTFAASVASTDSKLINHIYGAPRVGLPQRDPMVVTAEEKRSDCRKIILEEVYRAYADE